MKTNDTQNNAQHLERAPGSAAPRHQHPTHPCVCWWGGTVSLQSESGENGGLTTDANGVYQIGSAAALAEFRDKVNRGETIASAELTEDIDLSSVCSEEKGTWSPIGSISQQYRGTFDGNGKIISGLYIDSIADNQGLFGYVGGTVKNLTVSGSVTVSGSGDSIGGIVGYNYYGGTVKSCTFSGNVSGSNDVGGIVGINISGNDYVGGIAGYNSGSVENCSNSSKVSASASLAYVGAIVGRDDIGGSVTNCSNSSEVSASTQNAYVGGIVGYNTGRVENCSNTGSVTREDSNSDVGGVVGYNGSSASVTNCYFLQTDTVNVNLPGIGEGGGDATGKKRHRLPLRRSRLAAAEWAESSRGWQHPTSLGTERSHRRRFLANADRPG